MKPRRILIAEDDDHLLKVLQQVFKEKDFNVCLADNGTSALEQYRNYKPDVILMDIDMPEQNGWEVLHRIREENKIVPIIIMSGKKIKETDSLKSYDLGATFFILKPVRYQEIVAIIQSAINSAYGTEEVFVFGNFQLDMSSFLLTAGHEEYHLTEREAKTLVLLIKNSNRIVKTYDILNCVWHIDASPNNHQMLRNVIAKLNKILTKHGDISIESGYGRGYFLQMQNKGFMIY